MQLMKPVLLVAETACLLGCSSGQIYKLIHQGKLKAYKDEGARAWKIPEASIQEYINSRMNDKT